MSSWGREGSHVKSLTHISVFPFENMYVSNKSLRLFLDLSVHINSTFLYIHMRRSRMKSLEITLCLCTIHSDRQQRRSSLSFSRSEPQRRLQVSRKLRECFCLRRVRASDNGWFAGVCVGADLRVQRDVSQKSYAELLTLFLDT